MADAASWLTGQVVGHILRAGKGIEMPLVEERQTYEENAEKWRAAHNGQFVLVKGTELVGVFNTMDEALAEGARRFGLTSFLVRQVGAEQEEIKIPALTLGILRAAATHPVHGPTSGS